MECNIKVKVQTNGMITINQEDSIMTIHSTKMCRFIQDLGLESYAAKTRKNLNWWAFLSSRETVYWSSTKIFEQSHHGENQNDLNKYLECFDPSVQVHSCYLNNPQENADHNFDSEFQLEDLWLTNKTTFEKNWKIKLRWQSKTKTFLMHQTYSDMYFSWIN